jgi:hypothetical protein
VESGRGGLPQHVEEPAKNETVLDEESHSHGEAKAITHSSRALDKYGETHKTRKKDVGGGEVKEQPCAGEESFLRWALRSGGPCKHGTNPSPSIVSLL